MTLYFIDYSFGNKFQNAAAYDRGLDHNVREAWDLGYTGRGVVVTILDDGLERTHPDIAPNYVNSSKHIICLLLLLS